MKAIVLEIRDGEAAVLREDGVVVRVRQNCRVGDTIDVPERIEENRRVLKSRFTRLSRAVAMVLVTLLIAGGSFGYMTVSASSYVSVDAGNASLEFSVNHFGRVIAVNALDEESEELAAELGSELKNRKFDDAMDVCVARMEERGMLSETDERHIIAGVCGSERQRGELQEGLAQSFGRGEGEGGRFVMMDVSPEERKEAQGMHQSPGMFVFEQQGGFGPGGPGVPPRMDEPEDEPDEILEGEPGDMPEEGPDGMFEGGPGEMPEWNPDEMPEWDLDEMPEWDPDEMPDNGMQPPFPGGSEPPQPLEGGQPLGPVPQD